MKKKFIEGFDLHEIHIIADKILDIFNQEEVAPIKALAVLKFLNEAISDGSGVAIEESWFGDETKN